MAERIPQSVVIRVGLKAYLSSDHLTPATGKTIAITISKNGGAYANPSAGATNAVEIGNGSYYVDLSTTDTNTTGPLFVLGTASGVDNVDAIYDVATDMIGFGQAIPTNPTAGTLGEAFFYLESRVGRRGTAQGGTSTTITLDSGASSSDGFYTGFAIKLTGGTGSGQFATITGYVGLTKVATIARKGGAGGWDVVPDNTTTFLIEPQSLANVGMVSGTIQTAKDLGAGINTVLTAVAAVPTADQNASGWVAHVVGNGRTLGYYVQGGFNKTTRNNNALTVWAFDDTTVLVTGPLTQDGTLLPIATVTP